MSSVLTEQLRKSALTHGWPIEVANSLTATIADGVVTVHFPPEIIETVHDLEFGGLSPASVSAPAIRRFLNRVELGEWYLERLVAESGAL